MKNKGGGYIAFLIAWILLACCVEVAPCAAQVVINKNFVKQLIEIELAFTNESHERVLGTINSLDDEELRKIVVIIEDALRSDTGDILPLDYAMPWRVAGWMKNYISDKLGQLEYDRVVDGTFTRILGVGTVTYYEFKSLSGERINVILGMGTLSPDRALNGLEALEDYSGTIRLFLLNSEPKDSTGAPYFYITKMIVWSPIS